MDYEWHWDDYILDVQLENQRLREYYTKVQSGSRGHARHLAPFRELY